MKNYRLTEDGVQDIETTAFIPSDERNNDWREYQNWLKGLDADGEDLGTGENTPEPQFTAAELEAQLLQEERQAENAVIEAKLNLDAATAEGIDRKRFQDELIKAKKALVEVGARGCRK